MLESLATLQFAQLAALSVALAAPLLVLAYLRRAPTKRIIVSSLLLLKGLPKHATIQKRIKLPLRFFLELLALLLLAAAAAQPLLFDRGQRVALVLDNSLSMMTIATDGGKTRFQQAVERLTKRLTEASALDRFSLYQSSPKPLLVGNKLVSQADIERLVSDVAPGNAADSISVLAKELAGSGEYDRVLIITDREADFVADRAPLASSETASAAVIEAISVGGPAANWSIANLRVDRADVQDEAGSVVASLAYSGPSPAAVTAKLLGRDAATGGFSRLLTQQEVTLSPEQIVDVRFPLSRFREQRAFQVKLAAAQSGAGSKSENNSLTADDSAWVARDSSGGINLLLVSPEVDQKGALGLDTLPGINVSPITPKEFLDLPPSRIQQYALVIFHLVAPRSALTVPTLLVLPPDDNPVFPVRRTVQTPQISSWASDSPLTQYLRVALLEPTKALIFSVPAWGQAVINVESGAILVSGESQGVRFLGAGIELFPFEGARTPVLSILTLNAINWLTASSDVTHGYVTGSTLRLEPGKTWVAQLPDGKVRSLVTDATEPYFLQLDLPGVYEIAGGGIEGNNQKVKVRRTVVANSFFPDESATFEVQRLEIPREATSSANAGRARTPLWPWVIELVLGLMALEFLLRFRRSQREVSA
jgi:hypothetical protein